MQRFPFAFARSYRLAALPFGIQPDTAFVDVGDDLVIRFGPWKLVTPRNNVAGTEATGGFSFLKTAGPAHLSFADRGITFATNGERALCIRFAEPVRGIDPLGVLRHPAATVTITDPLGLAAALA